MQAPIPMTTSEITDVPSDRRIDSRAPSPQTTSSSSDFSPAVYRRSRYHPVAASATQNTRVSGASPSPVAFGCSVAPRPDGSRRLISGGGTRTRPRATVAARAMADSTPPRGQADAGRSGREQLLKQKYIGSASGRGGRPGHPPGHLCHRARRAPG